MQLDQQIFGDGEAAYVTRNQVVDLAETIYSTLHVQESYEVPESEFPKKFVDDLIELTAQHSFIPIPFEEALHLLSKYKLDITEDLQPNEIKKISSRMFRLETINHTKQIVIDYSEYNKYTSRTRSMERYCRSRSFLFFSWTRCWNEYYSYVQTHVNQDSRLDEQLEELNKMSKMDVQWAVEGSWIVPKTIRVALLIRSKFRTGLEFSRIRKISKEGVFERSFTVFTSEAATFWNPLGQVLENFQQEYDKYTSRLDDIAYFISDFFLKEIEVIDSKVDAGMSECQNSTTKVLQSWTLLDGRVSSMFDRLKEIQDKFMEVNTLTSEFATAYRFPT